jgi:NhaP-type Na+/H+ or K+/H+ antiporter
MTSAALYLAGILALGIGAQWLAWRFRLPAIVLLLAFGFALGWIYPQENLGSGEELFFAMISLAVGIILFEGGLSLDLREVRETHGVVLKLVTIGLALTWILTSGLAWLVVGFSFQLSLLTGALLTVSGPTVIVPLLRHVRPVRRIGSLAKWEGIVNDPIGAVLAALVFQLTIHQSEGHLATQSIRSLGLTLVVGVALAALGALLVVRMFRRYWVPDYLQNPLILSLVLLLFSLSNLLQEESGLVTVTLLGLLLANQRQVALRHVVEFKENLRVLLISTLFIVLASQVRIDLGALRLLGWESLLFLVLLILVVRPVSVFFSTLGSSLSWSERAFLGWMHPRGIVAAAVSSLLAMELGQTDQFAGEAERFMLLVFLVIVGTVTIYGLTLGPICKGLGLSGANPQGILFAGASPAVREIAAAIAGEGFPVLMVDTNPQNNKRARMAGLQVTHASISSEYVQEEIDLGGIGRLLAMTPNDEVNALATIEFTERFGRAEVYQIAPEETSSQRTERVSASRRGRTLFGEETTLELLESRFRQGWTVKSTRLTEDFTYDDFLVRYGDTAIGLFRLEDAGKLIVTTADSDAAPTPGQKLIALVQEASPDIS